MSLKSSDQSEGVEGSGSSAHLIPFKQSEIDMNLNDLRMRLQASKQELEPTISSLSSWLGDLIPLKLVAYWNPRNHVSYLRCENNEEESQDLLKRSHAIMEGPLPRIRHWRQENLLFHLWTGQPLDKWDRILVVESGVGMTAEESNRLMEEALGILQEPLRNAVEKVAC
ncbi:MAG: hypothetical protein HQL72_01515 [Magnetococcales bacterium]|nr:hypothetical protein [Magnetococcales bacterium]